VDRRLEAVIEAQAHPEIGVAECIEATDRQIASLVAVVDAMRALSAN